MQDLGKISRFCSRETCRDLCPLCVETKRGRHRTAPPGTRAFGGFERLTPQKQDPDKMTPKHDFNMLKHGFLCLPTLAPSQSYVHRSDKP